MMRVLQNIRDFLTEEQLKSFKYDLKALTAQNLLVLKGHKGGDDGAVYRTVLHIFTSDGTWIGDINEPDYIP